MTHDGAVDQTSVQRGGLAERLGRVFPKPSSRRWLLPASLLAVGIVWLSMGYSVEDARGVLSQLRERTRAESDPLLATLFGFAFVISGTLLMCLFTPKTVISIAAGVLFGMTLGSVLLSITAVVAATVNYHIGRWSFGRSDADSPPRPVSPDDARAHPHRAVIRRIAKTARDAGWGFHLIFRMSPLPTTVISYAMGAANARRGPYCVAALIATIPQWLWVYCGAVAGEEHVSMAQTVGVMCSIVAVLCLTVWIPRRFMNLDDDAVVTQ